MEMAAPGGNMNGDGLMFNRTLGQSKMNIFMSASVYMHGVCGWGAYLHLSGQVKSSWGVMACCGKGSIYTWTLAETDEVLARRVIRATR